MRNSFFQLTAILATIMTATPVFAQGVPQIINIPLSRPGEPLTLEISSLAAHIEVIGEDRDDLEFSVTVKQGTRKIITPSGTQPVTTGAYSLEVDEEDNHVSMDTDWRADKLTIIAHIPRRADLDLSTVDDGEIIFDGDDRPFDDAAFYACAGPQGFLE